MCPCPSADKFVAAASLLLRQNVWQQLLLRNPHNQLLRMYTEKKRARNYRGLWDRIDTELYLTGALIFDWCAALASLYLTGALIFDWCAALASLYLTGALIFDWTGALRWHQWTASGVVM